MRCDACVCVCQVNYFGKSEDLDNINVYPVLLRKGQTKVALYGLGNIRDERLHRAFSNDQVGEKGGRDARTEGGSARVNFIFPLSVVWHLLCVCKSGQVSCAEEECGG